MARSGSVPLVFLVAVSVAAAASGQKAPDNVTTFWSPMVLEVPADPIQAMRGGLTWRVTEFAGRSCQGISIPEIEIETSGDPEMRLKISHDIYLELDGDRGRKATLRLELLVDGQVVGVIEKERFHVSPGKRKRLAAKMVLSPVDASLVRMGTEPTLRVTLHVLD